MITENLLGTTESVCPECLVRIPAQKVSIGGEIYLIKTCPEHGDFKVLIWRGDQHSYTNWTNSKIPVTPTVCDTEINRGCPFDCGLCEDHKTDTCCLLLEVTSRCNLRCPVCFAEAEKDRGKDPDLDEIADWYRMLKSRGIPYNIQLSGGEPTVREDLPTIISMGQQFGFSYIQLNTNGIRLGHDPSYAKTLKYAGLSTVFLQFDGTTDAIYEKIRGKSLLKIKTTAIENCANAGLGVVLVPVLVPGVNMDNIGEIIHFAIDWMPAVRGVHFQPISYFGRYPDTPPQERITIPEIITAIESQTNGRLKKENFLPPGAENAYCSFHGNFVLTEDGALKPWATKESSTSCCKPISSTEGVKKAQSFVARQWVAPKNQSQSNSCCCNSQNTSSRSEGINVSSLDQFLNRVKDYTLAISGMAFQDAWNLDIDRLRECYIHVLSPDKKIIPFCAYNLTANNGTSLYRA
jgi:7,8-dihydro-6-hydroxymethylpterin dimethyltransferase